jgi:arylsulfatase A-like enzyme
MALEQRTMAESLKEAGYATACVGKWHLGGAAFGPEKQGFDVVHAGRANTPPSATEGGKGEYDLTTKATDFIRAQANKPFFLYLPHNTPHIPLGAKPELIEKYRGTFHPTYAAMMHTMDDCVGRILKTLEELKLTENTIVVFTSDNGGLHVPELRDYPPTHNTPYRAGKGFLYEGGLRIPAIVRWPGTIPPGRVSDSPFVNTDWLPTLLEAAGLVPRDPLDGVSTLPTLRGERPSRAPIFWHFPHYTNQGSRPAGAVRDGDWKLIEHYDDGRCELFNVISDPGEVKDLTAAEPARTAALKQKLAEWRKATKVQENRPNPNFDEALYKKLYRDTDVSRLKPSATAAETAASIGTWRRDFDAVVPKKP